MTFSSQEKIHGSVEPFWIIVEDQDSEAVLHHEYFILKRHLIDEDHSISFTVAINEPMPPQYFIKVRHLLCGSSLPIGAKKRNHDDLAEPPLL